MRRALRPEGPVRCAGLRPARSQPRVRAAYRDAGGLSIQVPGRAAERESVTGGARAVREASPILARPWIRRARRRWPRIGVDRRRSTAVVEGRGIYESAIRGVADPRFMAKPIYELSVHANVDL